MGIHMMCLISIGLLLSGCASVESRWRDAQQQNTVMAYEIFVQKCPQSPYTSAAQDRIEQLKFEQAQRVGTTAALEGFVKEYPDGKNATVAREQLDQMKYLQAKQTGKAAAYDTYIAAYPNGRFVSEARAAAEELSWSAAQGDGTKTAYLEFIRKYPDSKHILSAKEAVEQGEWNEAEAKNTEEAYEAYLAAHPTSNRKAEVMKKLRNKRLFDACQTCTLAEYEEYLKRNLDENEEDLRREMLAIREALWLMQLGKLVISLSPVMKVDMGGGGMSLAGNFINPPGGQAASATLEPRVKVQDVLPEIKRLLEAGVNPNMIRIRGFAPSSRKSLGGGAELVSSGSPGEVVLLGKEGMTLLEYCQANKFDAVSDLLKTHGAK